MVKYNTQLEDNAVIILIWVQVPRGEPSSCHNGHNHRLRGVQARATAFCRRQRRPMLGPMNAVVGSARVGTGENVTNASQAVTRDA